MSAACSSDSRDHSHAYLRGGADDKCDVGCQVKDKQRGPKSRPTSQTAASRRVGAARSSVAAVLSCRVRWNGLPNSLHLVVAGRDLIAPNANWRKNIDASAPVPEPPCADSARQPTLSDESLRTTPPSTSFAPPRVWYTSPDLSVRIAAQRWLLFNVHSPITLAPFLTLITRHQFRPTESKRAHRSRVIVCLLRLI